MKKSITIRYCLCDLPPQSRVFKDGHAWREDIRAAVTSFGFVVDYHGPASSTDVEDDLLILESEGQEVDSRTLAEFLTRFELASAGYWGDGVVPASGSSPTA